ncbi:cobalamin biosynthesis protein [Mesorhizobium sp. ANAO-SY3R2]|uniref:cobalamin biosynthesis protein n=1 Tax=Mesorhizobium sp. ANAO-SY3R2 TaxID=3166644 RepID=UPI0036714581
MMIAGIGCRKGVAPEDILSAIETALEAHGLAVTALSALATASIKSGEQAILAAGHRFDLPVLVVDDASLAAAASRTLTRSEASIEATGSPSVSEAAALAAAGEGSTLIGPRIVVGPATCAIAISGARI